MKKNILKLAGIILAVSVLSGCNITTDPAADRDEKDEETTKETTSADEEETEGSEASEETSGSEETSVTTTAAESDADSNDDQGAAGLASYDYEWQYDVILAQTDRLTVDTEGNTILRGYTVTDLDYDGYLDFIAVSLSGTAHFCTTSIYEVSPENGGSLQEIDIDREEGMDSPDLSLNSEVSIYYDSNTGVYHYFIVSYQSTVDTVESTVYEEFYYDVNTDMYTSTPYLRVEHDTATGEDIYYEYASGGIWNEISSEAAETTITSVDTLGEAYHDFIWFDVITRDNLEGAYQSVG